LAFSSSVSEAYNRAPLARTDRAEERTTLGFEVAARELEHIIVVDVVGRLTLRDGRTRLRDLVHVFLANGHRNFLINLAHVDAIDSDGLGELTRSYCVVRQAGGEMKLVHVHDRVEALLEMTRIKNLFEIHSDEHSALQAFARRQ
jgi:anti-sigma B factor antagonist